MMNSILVICFSLSMNAGNANLPETQSEAVSPAQAQALYDLMESNRQRIFAGLGEDRDPSVSPEEAQELYSQIEDNRKRIFDSIGEKVEQDLQAGLDTLNQGEEAVYVSVAK